MDWLLTLRAGLKAGAIALFAVIAGVLAGALSYAMGFKPEGALPQVIMTYIIVPLFAGIIGCINNWLKHRN